ncbi:MAG: hypothetical protein Q8N51_13785 [Gammaproteobacteria bacterium]|nr:hypothetical protein [Gammaproteobacteria bacterium]
MRIRLYSAKDTYHCYVRAHFGAPIRSITWANYQASSFSRIAEPTDAEVAQLVLDFLDDQLQWIRLRDFCRTHRAVHAHRDFNDAVFKPNAMLFKAYCIWTEPQDDDAIIELRDLAMAALLPP